MTSNRSSNSKTRLDEKIEGSYLLTQKPTYIWIMCVAPNNEAGMGWECETWRDGMQTYAKGELLWSCEGILLLLANWIEAFLMIQETGSRARKVVVAVTLMRVSHYYTECVAKWMMMVAGYWSTNRHWIVWLWQTICVTCSVPDLINSRSAACK